MSQSQDSIQCGLVSLPLLHPMRSCRVRSSSELIDTLPPVSLCTNIDYIHRTRHQDKSHRSTDVRQNGSDRTEEQSESCCFLEMKLRLIGFRLFVTNCAANVLNCLSIVGRLEFDTYSLAAFAHRAIDF